MIDNIQLEQVRHKIESILINKLQNGNQNLGLPRKTIACGQFISNNSPQRGIHGSTAALLILSLSNNEEKNILIPQLLNYIKDYEKIEKKIGKKNPTKIELNKSNIIKISELLIALKNIQQGESRTSKYKNSLIKILKDSKTINQWPYFIDEGNLDILPTCFACIALHVNGFHKEIGNSINHLKDFLRKNAEEINSNILIFSKFVFAIYTLDRVSYDNDNLNIKEIKRYLNKVIKSKLYNMEADMEQMIQYNHGNDHYYIRIPWQLYLIHLLSKYKVLSFSSKSIQDRLKSIIVGLNQNGFFYPNFHNSPSTRTYSIVYELFKNLSYSVSTSVIIFFQRIFKKIRDFINNNWVKTIIVILVIIIIIFSFIKWYTDPNKKIEDFIPSIIAELLLFLLAIRSK